MIHIQNAGTIVEGIKALFFINTEPLSLFCFFSIGVLKYSRRTLQAQVAILNLLCHIRCNASAQQSFVSTRNVHTYHWTKALSVGLRWPRKCFSCTNADYYEQFPHQQPLPQIFTMRAPNLSYCRFIEVTWIMHHVYRFAQMHLALHLVCLAVLPTKNSSFFFLPSPCGQNVYVRVVSSCRNLAVWVSIDLCASQLLRYLRRGVISHSIVY